MDDFGNCVPVHRFKEFAKYLREQKFLPIVPIELTIIRHRKSRFNYQAIMEDLMRQHPDGLSVTQICKIIEQDRNNVMCYFNRNRHLYTGNSKTEIWKLKNGS